MPNLRNVTPNLTSNHILYETMSTIFHLINAKEAMCVASPRCFRAQSLGPDQNSPNEELCYNWQFRMPTRF